MADKFSTKPGRELVPAHRRNVPSTLSRVDPLTGRPRLPGELPRSTAPPIDPISAAFGYPVGASPFQKPSDLLSGTQEPSVEDIRRVLGEHKHLLTEQSIPLTEHSMKMFDAARRKYGTEALAWGENWEEAGKELGFETDDQLRTLINDIYAVSERETEDTRNEFWALEGPAFERTVQNILEKRRDPEEGGIADLPMGVEPTSKPGFGTVYHGTDHEGKIVEFNVPAYFTDKKEFAQRFGKNITEAEIHITNPYELDGLTEGRHFDWDKEDIDRMIEEGYDGVVIRHPDGDVYTVFDPSQISQRNEGKAHGGFVDKPLYDRAI